MSTLDDLIPNTKRLTEGYEPTSVHCSFVTGAAGTGKTYQQRQKILTDQKYGVLAATTGIAAINLGTTTLNSILRYFDTESLRDRFNRGTLTATLHKLGRNCRRLVVDEVSMMDARQLDYIYQAMLQVNEYQDMQKEPMGIVLTGDFCQLPPVKADFAFKAECWEHFERNTERLTKVWRQDDPQFLEAINAARAGDGGKCVELLKGLDVKFVPQSIHNFEGTTILPKNNQVDNYNFSRLLTVKEESFVLKARTWGEQSGEWKNIPMDLKLKDGAYVMILSNDTEGWTYANGDCGHVRRRDEKTGAVWVELVRNGNLVPILPIIRYKSISHEDGRKLGLRADDPGITEFDESAQDEVLSPRVVRPRIAHLYCDGECGWDSPGLRHGPWGFPSYNCQPGTFNTGAIEFYPLRLAWASTVHKSQGLTLDMCQIDCRDHFFGEPGMAYVALSRCRSAKGLTIVGDPAKLADRIKTNLAVTRWI